MPGIVLNRLHSLLVIVAILLGSLAAPASARAETALSGHGNEILQVLDHAEDVHSDDSRTPPGEAPCQFSGHHHCSVALTVDSAGLKQAISLRASDLVPPAATALSSLSQAPPTQPPSA